MMNATRTCSLSFVATALIALVACGGGQVEPEATTPAAATPAQVDKHPDDTLPSITCPESAEYRFQKTAEGMEQYCEAIGVLHGPFRRWKDAETKLVDGEYANGLPSGMWSWNYDSGDRKSRGSYRGGKQVGAWAWWHEDGSRSEEGDFLAGHKAGLWTTWYTSGKKREEGLYRNGEKHGEWYSFRNDKQNTKLKIEVFTSGRVTETIWYDEQGEETEAPEGTQAG